MPPSSLTPAATHLLRPGRGEGRIDGELLRATTVQHPSGLKVIAAPASLMPLDAVTSEQIIEIVDIAKRASSERCSWISPSSWTNWSLSLLAQADLVLLVTELSIGGLHRAGAKSICFGSRILPPWTCVSS